MTSGDGGGESLATCGVFLFDLAGSSHSRRAQRPGRHPVASSDGAQNRVASGDAAFEWVSSRSPWGPPTIDLFANKFNTQLPRYFSPCPDMHAVSVDALLSPWPREVCYAFPPITLLQQVCVKLLQERPTTLLLVAPVSPVAS